MITRTKVVGILRKGDIMGIFWGRLKTYYNWSMWYFHSCLLKQFCWPFVFYVPMKNSWETFQLKYRFSSVQFSSLSRVWLFATPWIAARQASVSITNSWSSFRLTLIASNSFWPWMCSPPGSSAHGILQAKKLEWVAVPFSRGSSGPRDKTWVFCTSRGFFTTGAPGKPMYPSRS